MADSDISYYMGKRLTNSKQMKHTFTNGEGEQWHYPKAKDVNFLGLTIGRAYRFKRGDNLPQLWSDLQTGTVHNDYEKWQTESRVDWEIKKEGAKPVDPELSDIVDQLKDMCSRMNSNEKSKFLAYLINKLMKW